MKPNSTAKCGTGTIGEESHCTQVRLAREPQRSEPPDADPHVRWCGREVGESLSPTPYPAPPNDPLSMAGVPPLAKPRLLRGGRAEVASSLKPPHPRVLQVRLRGDHSCDAEHVVQGQRTSKTLCRSRRFCRDSVVMYLRIIGSNADYVLLAYVLAATCRSRMRSVNGRGRFRWRPCSELRVVFHSPAGIANRSTTRSSTCIRLITLQWGHPGDLLRWPCRDGRLSPARSVSSTTCSKSRGTRRLRVCSW